MSQLTRRSSDGSRRAPANDVGSVFAIVIACLIAGPIIGYVWSKNWLFAIGMLPLSLVAVALAIVAALRRRWLATALGVLGPIGSLALVGYDLAHLETQTVRSGHLFADAGKEALEAAHKHCPEPRTPVDVALSNCEVWQYLSHEAQQLAPKVRVARSGANPLVFFSLRPGSMMLVAYSPASDVGPGRDPRHPCRPLDSGVFLCGQ
jgi:hypothetical protein